MKSPFMFKKIIYPSCVCLFICFFFSNCDAVDWSLLYAKQIDTSTDVRRQNLRDRVRQRVLKDTSNPCRDSKSCKSACEDMYLKAGDLNQCYNTGEDKIKRILEVFDVLIAPDRSSELNSIDVNDFKIFLDIGWRGFFDLIDPSHRDEDGDRRDYDKEDLYAYDSDTSHLVLEWIANKPEIAKAIASEDKNREIMRHLFCIYGEEALDDRLDDSGHLVGISYPASRDSSIITEQTAIIENTRNETSCYDNRAQILLGFADNAFDDVSFITYADSKENNKAVELAVDVVDTVCLEGNGNALICENLHYCLALKYENLDRSIFPAYGFNGGTVNCNSYFNR